jgi:DNA repair protein RadD
VTPGNLPKCKRGKRSGYTVEQKAQFFAELKTYGQQYGRKEGWAAHSYREKFGAWPERSMRDIEPAPSVSLTTVSWVRSRNIRWARSRKQQRDSGAAHA